MTGVQTCALPIYCPTTTWRDTDALCKAILRLMAAPPPRAEVRALVEKFTWQRVATEMADFYRELHRPVARKPGALRAV